MKFWVGSSFTFAFFASRGQIQGRGNSESDKSIENCLHSFYTGLFALGDAGRGKIPRATFADADRSTGTTVSELELLKGVAGKEPRQVNWADLAKKHCAELYLLLYRPLSSDGTHTTVYAINRHLEADEEFRVTGLKGGPELTDIVDTFSIACLSFIWALNSFEEMRGADGQQVQSFLRKFKELSNDQPIQLKIG